MPLSTPHLGGKEWEYVQHCLDTNWVSSAGAYVDRFERELAARVGAPGAVACSSGTSALHVALLMSGVQAGDEVVVSSLTFIASANAVAYTGARPVFIDAEDEHYQMDVAKLEAFLTEGCTQEDDGLRNAETGARVRAIMPVHILGHACDMDPIVALAERYGLLLIEDAAEALGTRYRGRAAGTIGGLGCYSFNGNKLITAGNGGMIVSHDPSLLQRAKYLTTQAKDDEEEFVHREVGFNYRLSNVSAAIGLAQLERLDEHIEDKRRIGARYEAALGDVDGIRTPRVAPWCEPNHWLYTIRIDAERFGASARVVRDALRAQRIESRTLWQPMHRSPAHAGAFAFRCEVADTLADECLSIPCSVGLSEADQDRVIGAILDQRAPR